MAYQPKSYRKFVATAATATLVASAVTPVLGAETRAAAEFTDVTERHQEAVKYLVDNKITLGLTPTTFGTQQTIKRVDAAVMIAKALELNIDGAPDSGFTDVPDRAKAYVDALKAKGLINGKTATSFGSEQEITRGEMALILARAYELTGNTANVEFTDVSSRYLEAVAALVDNEITRGVSETSFGTTAAIKRGDFAIFLFKAETLPLEEVLEVANVQATSSTTIEVTFNNELTAEEAGELEFTFDPELAVTDVELKEEASTSAEGDVTTTVVVTTEEQVAGTEYELVAVNGVALEAAVPVAPIETPDAPTIESVEATSTRTVQVNFTAPVAQNATFRVTREGGAVVNVSETSLNEDRTTATLTFANEFAGGNYTLTVVSGETTLTEAFELQEEVVDKIVIPSNVAIVNNNENPTSATVAYQVLNQYGEDITDEVTVTPTSSYGTVAQSEDDGVLTITAPTGGRFTLGSNVTVSLIHGATGTFVNKTVQVSAEARVASFDIEGLHNVSGETARQGESTAGYSLLVKAVDQYGNALEADELGTAGRDFIVNSSNPSVATLNVDAATNVTVQGQEYISIPLATGTFGLGSTVFNLISATTGQSDSFTLTTRAALAVQTLTIGAPEMAVSGEIIELPFTAVDQEGNAVTSLEQLNAINFSIANAPNGLDNADVNFVRDSATNRVVLQLDTSDVTLTSNQTITLIATTNGGQVVQRSITLRPNAAVATVSGLDGVEANILEGDTVDLGAENFTFRDQYGRVLDLDDLDLGTDLNDYQIVVSSSNENVISVEGEGSSAVIAGTGDTDVVSLTGVAEGTANITVSLSRVTTAADGSTPAATTTVANSSFRYTARVIDAADVTSLEVGEIGVLNDERTITNQAGETVAAEAGEAGFEEYELNIYGVDTAGNRVLLPEDSVTLTSTRNALAYDNADGVVVASGTVPYASSTVNVADVNFIVSALGLTKDGTAKVSREEAIASSAELATTGGVTRVSNTVVTAEAGTSLATVLAALEIEDQYGAPIADEDADITSVPSQFRNASGERLTSATPETVEAGGSYMVTVLLENGERFTFTVRVV